MIRTTTTVTDIYDLYDQFFGYIAANLAGFTQISPTELQFGAVTMELSDVADSNVIYVNNSPVFVTFGEMKNQMPAGDAYFYSNASQAFCVYNSPDEEFYHVSIGVLSGCGSFGVAETNLYVTANNGKSGGRCFGDSSGIILNDSGVVSVCRMIIPSSPGNRYAQLLLRGNSYSGRPMLQPITARTFGAESEYGSQKCYLAGKIENVLACNPLDFIEPGSLISVGGVNYRFYPVFTLNRNSQILDYDSIFIVYDES